MPQTWLIGAGKLALEYAKILNALNQDYIPFGRGVDSAKLFQEQTGKEVYREDISHYLNSTDDSLLPEFAIITVSVENLAKVTIDAINLGIKNILVEKPLGLNSEEIQKVYEISIEKQANVFIGFNRRFFASTLQARKMIQEDGGVKSIHFEFTEWPNVFTDPKNSKKTKEKWLLANSSHVIDLAFYFAGDPVTLQSFIRGGTTEHPSGTIFCGAGVTTNDALFTYHANWESSGRWSIEVMTNKQRFIFAPMEELKVQAISSIKQEKIELKNELDMQYKPGLYLQVQKFLTKDWQELYTISKMVESIDTYNKIAGYEQ